MNHKDPFFEANKKVTLATKATPKERARDLDDACSFGLHKFRTLVLSQTAVFGALLFYALKTYETARLAGRIDLEIIGLSGALGIGVAWSTFFIKRQVVYQRLVALYPALGGRSPKLLHFSYFSSPISFFGMMLFLFFKETPVENRKKIPFALKYPYLVGPIPMVLTLGLALSQHYHSNFSPNSTPNRTLKVPDQIRPYLVGATTHYMFNTLDEYTEFNRYSHELEKNPTHSFELVSEVVARKATTSAGAIVYSFLLMKEFAKHQSDHKEIPEKTQIMSISQSMLKLVTHWDSLDSFLAMTPKIAFISPSYTTEWSVIALMDLAMDQKAKDKTFEIVEDLLTQLDKATTQSLSAKQALSPALVTAGAGTDSGAEAQNNEGDRIPATEDPSTAALKNVAKLAESALNGSTTGAIALTPESVAAALHPTQSNGSILSAPNPEVTEMRNSLKKTRHISGKEKSTLLPSFLALLERLRPGPPRSDTISPERKPAAKM